MSANADKGTAYYSLPGSILCYLEVKNPKEVIHMNIFSPQGFLTIGGTLLLVVGILGFFVLIGPTQESSLFGDYWYFDNAENIAHLVLGLVALGVAFGLEDATTKKWLVAAVGALGVLFGLYSLFGPIPEGSTFLGAALQNPADTLLHFVIGAWGLAAAFGKSAESAPLAQMPPMSKPEAPMG